MNEAKQPLTLAELAARAEAFPDGCWLGSAAHDFVVAAPRLLADLLALVGDWEQPSCQCQKGRRAIGCSPCGADEEGRRNASQLRALIGVASPGEAE